MDNIFVIMASQGQYEDVCYWPICYYLSLEEANQNIIKLGKELNIDYYLYINQKEKFEKENEKLLKKYESNYDEYEKELIKLYDKYPNAYEYVDEIFLNILSIKQGI